MFILYDIIFALFAVFYFPYMIIRGKWHSGFKMRFGDLKTLSEKLDTKERIWIHAVSVGEVLAVADLIQKINETFPQHTIICSTVTKTGNQLAKEQLGDRCIVMYAPLDFSWVVRKFIRMINPRIYIAAETEIWPNLYTALHKHGVPIVQINGRISDNSFKGYRSIRFLIKRVLACVNTFCMQGPFDAQRIKQLGADPQKIHIVGNLKFDNIPQVTEIQKSDLGFKAEEDLLIAGSTHPGEEDILVDVYRDLIVEFPHLRLVVAPRHIERAGSIMELIEKKGYRPVRFSDIQTHTADPKSIVVVDTIGHLRELYSLAKIVFIGKTLTVGGGQNMIESACLGKPTIVGPMTQNFKDAAHILLRAGGLIQVNDAQELSATIRKLLNNPDQAKKIGEVARRTIENCRGATAKTIEEIGKLLG